MIRRKLPLIAHGALAVLVGASFAAADPVPPAKAASKKGAEAPKSGGTQKQVEEKAEDTSKGLGALGKMLPIGQKNLDARMPSFRDGKPSSLIHAGSMTRTDEDHMEMENVDIRLFGETAEADLRVQLHTGLYDMNTQVLLSHERSRVSRNDFQLEGDTMVFDTKSQQGKMEGHVHMIIFDASALKKKPEGATPTGVPAEKPAAQGRNTASADAHPDKVQK